MKYICDCGKVYSDLAGITACQANNHGKPRPADPKIAYKLKTIVRLTEQARHYLVQGDYKKADHTLCVIHELGIDIAELLGIVEPVHEESF